MHRGGLHTFGQRLLLALAFVHRFSERLGAFGVLPWAWAGAGMAKRMGDWDGRGRYPVYVFSEVLLVEFWTAILYVT